MLVAKETHRLHILEVFLRESGSLLRLSGWRLYLEWKQRLRVIQWLLRLKAKFASHWEGTEG